MPILQGRQARCLSSHEFLCHPKIADAVARSSAVEELSGFVKKIEKNEAIIEHKYFIA